MHGFNMLLIIVTHDETIDEYDYSVLDFIAR